MLRRFFNSVSSGNALSLEEQTAIEQLCESQGQLLMDGELVDVKSEAGYAACSSYLCNVDLAARALNLEIASRAYRSSFSTNYRALFPDSNRHYRVDVLEASVDQEFAMWVNGEKFELSMDAIGHAGTLQRCWAELSNVLVRWSAAAEPCSRTDLTDSLTVFDVAWANFESRYIGELIAIEEKARHLIVEAAEAELDLQTAEQQKDTVLQDEAEQRFVRCVQHLNSVANFKRKGRDDLGCDTLQRAKEVLQQCRHRQTRGQEAAHCLASDLMGSYHAIRQYFRKVSNCIEHVDPHLCNNAGLVALLVDWEETWEVGSRYIRPAPLLDAMCDLVSEIRGAQQIVPELTAMMENCDVELFMVLPRIVILSFLADPTNKRTELVRSLLPHRFSTPAPGATDAAALKVDPELKALHNKYRETMQFLAINGASKAAFWERLMKQAILGDEQAAGNADQETSQRALAELLRATERWSLELQRHCPEDWNQCSAVLVHCLEGSQQKKVAVKFQI